MASMLRALGRRLLLAGDRPAGRHVSDDLLLDVVRGSAKAHGADRSATDAHLDACQSCADRLADLDTFFDAIKEESIDAFADAISAARLTAERERIMRRVERVTERRGAAHILRFPVLARPALAAVSRAHRWIGAAAVAGLLIGVAIGQFVHLHTDPDPLTARGAVPGSATTTEPSSTTSDEQFMEDLELALTRPRVPALVALDEMTPLMREIAVNIR